MQTTTNQQQSQLTPAEARAHLGVVTNMMQGMIPQAPQAPQTQESAPEEKEPQEDIGSKIQTAVIEQLKPIQDEIKKVLEEEKVEKPEEDKTAQDVAELKTMFTEFMKDSKTRNDDMDSFKKGITDALK